jgi:hypothetical protein
MRASFCVAMWAVASIQGAVPLRQVPPALASCRHDANSAEADRNRRAQAVTLAKAIITAQAGVVRRTGQYHPVASLGKLPTVPAGFSLKLFADRDDYVFALKDTLDPCRYAIFSDSAGLLYEKSARSAPVIAR